MNVLEIPNQSLQPGVYEWPFQLTLPNDIPSSLAFEDKKHNRHKPKAKVKYYIKATLHAYDKHDDMKYK